MSLRKARSAIVLAGWLPVCAAAATACHSNSGNPAPPPPPVVEIVSAEQKTVPIYQQFLGQTAAIIPVEIRPQVTGLLREIAFQGGATVRKGNSCSQSTPASIRRRWRRPTWRRPRRH
jgi:membrane fusion protein (multidrug efflux system)